MQSGGPSGTGLMEHVLRDHPPSNQDWDDAIQMFKYKAKSCIKIKHGTIKSYLKRRLLSSNKSNIPNKIK